MEDGYGKAIIGVDLARGPDYSVLSDGTVVLNPEWNDDDQ